MSNVNNQSDSSAESIPLPTRRRRARGRINYRLLNGGSDEDAISADDSGSDPGPSTKKSRLDTTMFSLESATDLGNSTTQQPSIAGPESTPSLTPNPTGRRKSVRKPLNQWLWSQFDVEPIPGKQWRPKRGKGLQPLQEDREIKCLRCGWKTTDSVRASSTTNMKSHLLAKHNLSEGGQEADQEQETEVGMRTVSKQKSIASLFQKKNEKDIKNSLERNMLRWMVMDDMAFSAIESPFFQQIFKDLPGVSLPFSSRKTVSRRIEAEFEHYRAQLINDLELNCSTIALSLDVWTSSNSKSILGVIGHWLTAEFEYKVRVLDFVELIGSHTGENIAEILQKLLMELRIGHKLLTITADNASNNETMMSELFFGLQEKLTTDDIEFFEMKPLRFRGKDSYIRCLAHVLNLIVGDILASLKCGTLNTSIEACDRLQQNKEIGQHSPLARLRIIALWISRTPQRRQQWKVICESHKLSHKLIEYDVPTRWNSTHRMLRDGLNAKTQIKKWLEHESQFPRFSPDDWSYLQQLETVLSKFDEYTQLVSKQEPQISLAIPIYYELHDMLEDAASREGEFSAFDPAILSALSAGLEKYQKYYLLMDGQDAYYIALILDPRFKTLLLKRELGNDATQDIIKTIRDFLHDQYPPQASHDMPASGSDQAAIDNRPSLQNRVLKKLRPQTTSRSDIDFYLDEDIVDIPESVTREGNWLCSWWRKHADEYPRMAAAARDYLAIPAAEVAVERLFSHGRDILGVRRYSLQGETMRRLMFLRSAYKPETELES